MSPPVAGSLHRLGARAHGAMNKERHVCARRRVGEAAGPDELSDRRQKPFSIPETTARAPYAL